MSTRNRLLFFLTAWLIVLMPFLFWWNTWFGRQLSDKQLAEYLQDEKHPRHMQHALVQIGERMARHDRSVTRWYPELVRLASSPVEEVRNTDAWVMGQGVTGIGVTGDGVAGNGVTGNGVMGNGAMGNAAMGNDTAGAGFHAALLKMLNDSSLTVRGNAALSLLRFGDATGRPQIIALLQPAAVTAPQSGRVINSSTVGTAIHQGGIVAKIEAGGQITELRSPISGRLRTLSVQIGQTVAARAEIATIAPATEQVWEALRALYLIGQVDDLPAVLPYERDLPDIPDHVRQQAVLTEKAIRERERAGK